MDDKPLTKFQFPTIATCPVDSGICFLIPHLPYLIPVLILLYFRTHFPAIICDDAFITMKSALNLAEGRGFTFNLDQRIWLVTTPVWAFLLALGRFITTDIILSVKMWGVFFEICFILSVVRLGNLLSGNKWTGMLLGVLMVTNPVYMYASFSGMEISLSMFVITLSLILLFKKQYTWSLVAAVFAVWVRFDGLLIFGVILVSVIMLQWKEISKSPGKLIREVLPSIVMLGLYFLLGYLYFGDIIPTSVQAKYIHGARMFSQEWNEGVIIVIREFGKVFMGESGRWFVAVTPFWIMIIPLMIGIFRLSILSNRDVKPLVVFTVLYATGFIASGNFYAQFFPWYFVPVLPGIYYIVAIGLTWLIELIAGLFVKAKDRAGESARLKSVLIGVPGLITIVLVLIWTSIMLGPLKFDGNHFKAASDLRERSYAAATLWLGNHLEDSAMISSLEIGVIGFYARPDIEIQDLFGILRIREERWINGIDLIRIHQPEAVIILQPFLLPEFMDEDMFANYEATRRNYNWFEFKGLEIGLWHTLDAPLIDTDLDELSELYENVDMEREYVWF